MLESKNVKMKLYIFSSLKTTLKRKIEPMFSFINIKSYLNII